MKEAYCSFEISKLLKEKGFAEPCNKVYNGEGIITEERLTPVVPFRYKEKKKYLCPTHQVAMAWLREKFHIFIEVNVSIELNGRYHYSYSILDKECRYIRKGCTDFNWNHEDAVDAALKYTLKII